MATARNLIVLRCGDDSLHGGWVTSDLQPNWDLGVSYFGANETRNFPEARYSHKFKGGKWNGIYSFFDSFPETLESYDYFWFPDDDIEASCAQINHMFRMMETYDFELAQPSLSSGSYLSHLITLSNSWFAYRSVNFVELMVPVFSRSLLVKTLPLFKTTRSGFGMDFVWHRFTTNPIKKVAILDDVQVTHTRPVGGALHKMLKTEGVTPARQEQDIFLRPYADAGTTELVLGGLLHNGVYVSSGLLARLIAVVGWSLHPFGHKGFTKPITAWRFWVWVARHFLTATFHPVSLTRIEPELSSEAGGIHSSQQLELQQTSRR
jgi:hypothetical protein